LFEKTEEMENGHEFVFPISSKELLCKYCIRDTYFESVMWILNGLTLEAPVVLHYLKAPMAVKLTSVCFIAF
jgi:hypothetical protein